MKSALFLFLTLFSNALISAQSDTIKSNLLSRFYFPFDFGYNFLILKNTPSGGLIKTGLEFRFKKENGVFLRFNFDNRFHQYTIRENSVTNVTKGRLRFNDYLAGVGYRIGDSKIKTIGLVQIGIATYEYPVVIGWANHLQIENRQSQTTVIKTIVGFEFYIAQNAALTLETNWNLQPKRSIFWNQYFNTLSISLGLTTTLF
jgi:hypothetical protein